MRPLHMVQGRPSGRVSKYVILSCKTLLGADGTQTLRHETKLPGWALMVHSHRVCANPDRQGHSMLAQLLDIEKCEMKSYQDDR